MLLNFRTKLKSASIGAITFHIITSPINVTMTSCNAMEMQDFSKQTPGLGYSCWPDSVKNCMNMDITLTPDFFKSQLSGPNLDRQQEFDRCTAKINEIQERRKIEWNLMSIEQQKSCAKTFNRDTTQFLKGKLNADNTADLLSLKCTLEKQLAPYTFNVSVK